MAVSEGEEKKVSLKKASETILVIDSGKLTSTLKTFTKESLKYAMYNATQALKYLPDIKENAKTKEEIKETIENIKSARFHFESTINSLYP